jgi:hypothetical protein
MPSFSWRSLILCDFANLFFQADCLDDLAFAIMHEMSKLSYRVMEEDVIRARNQVMFVVVMGEHCHAHIVSQFTQTLHATKHDVCCSLSFGLKRQS